MAITYPPIFKATFRIREAYGNTRAYPVSREAVLLCQLTGTKTLLPQQMEAIRELGFECLDTEGKVISSIDLYWETLWTPLIITYSTNTLSITLPMLRMNKKD